MSKTKLELLKIIKQNEIDIDENITINEMGLDFQVVFHTDSNGDKWVLRFPRKISVYEKSLYEKEILDYLNKGFLLFSVPFFEVCTEDLIAYKSVVGNPAVIANDDYSLKWAFDISNLPKEYTKSLAKVLVNLHQVSKREDLPKELVKLEANELKQKMKDRINHINTHFEISKSKIDRWNKWLENELLWPEQVGLIHGDLYPGHTLIDDNNNIIGVIDWTEVKISDVSYDFLAHYKLFGEEELDNLIEEYKNNGGYTWDNMKEHIVELLSTEALTIAEFALASNNNEYFELGKQLLAED